MEQRGEQAMSQLSQDAFAGVLEAAWAHGQRVREETGVVVELRLTTIGLTALVADGPCDVTATVSWQDLAGSDDLLGLLCARIADVARQRTDAQRPARMAA
ncbi:hypothetical protein [Methylobacterium durans]|uniref:Uncharacterized protein n=1 Tax=Methylobacterium durans TaxID=2202825 RepID=A0A2U8WC93_9HYPH|nr:hypothetical protein [Methylobacterium durans]AWN43669.1 hypothetical protein DK389_28105 [Methylobacterium durans]